jgi:hypothetical protein
MKDSAHNATIKASIDRDNPNSLVSLIEGDAFANAVSKVPMDIWKLGEDELKKRAKPTRTDYALRIALWNEFRISGVSGQPIPPSRIYVNICSYQNWYHNVLNNPNKLAWLLCPIQDYEDALRPLLLCVPDRYAEILNLDIHDESGKPVPSLVKLVLRAMEQIEGRLCGSVVQKVESKSLGIFLRPTPETPRTVGEREERLRQLQERERLWEEKFYSSGKGASATGRESEP